MNVEYHSDPYPHVIYDDLFSSEQLEKIWVEIKFFDNRYPDLKHSGIGIKENDSYLGNKEAIWLTGCGYLKYHNFDMIKSMKETIYSLDGNQWDPLWIRDLWRSTNSDETLLCKYNNGDYHESHRDLSIFTNLIWLRDPTKTFEGGDLYFEDYSYYTIECKDNRAVSILSSTRHGVTEINGEGRYCMSNFMEIFKNR